MKKRRIFALVAVVSFSFAALFAKNIADKSEDDEYTESSTESMIKNKIESEISVEENYQRLMALLEMPNGLSDVEKTMIPIPEKNYSMLAVEVTQKLYYSVIGKNPSKFSNELGPVEKVSWLDAIDFCDALSEQQGLKKCYSNRRMFYYNLNTDKVVNKIAYKRDSRKKIEDRCVVKCYEVDCDFEADGYRLPTVEEWQYAAKAGEDYIYSGSDNLDEVGWYNKNSGKKTHLVAQKKPNAYGFYDMCGNVSEWAWDHKGRYWVCFCGGSLDDYPQFCKASSYGISNPNNNDKRFGLRIVRTTLNNE